MAKKAAKKRTKRARAPRTKAPKVLFMVEARHGDGTYHHEAGPFRDKEAALRASVSAVALVGQGGAVATVYELQQGSARKLVHQQKHASAIAPTQ